MRDIIVAVVFVVIGTPTNCLATAEAPAEDRPPDASLAWVDCGSREPPAILVEVWRDGRVKFIGSEQVRSSGEKLESYDRGASKKVLSEIHELSRRKLDVARPQQSPDDLPLDKQLCVLAKSTLGDRLQEGLVNVSSRARIPRALKAIEKTLGVNERICPLRSAESELAIGGSDYCDGPLLVFVDPVATACYSYRSFHLYPRGIARQSAVLVVPSNGTSTSFRTIGDEYLDIESRKAEAVLVKAESLTPTHDYIEDPGQTFDYFRSFGTAEERAQFATFLSQQLGFNWIPVPEVSACGGTRGSAVSMLNVYGKPSNKK